MSWSCWHTGCSRLRFALGKGNTERPFRLCPVDPRVQVVLFRQDLPDLLRVPVVQRGLALQVCQPRLSRPVILRVLVSPWVQLGLVVPFLHLRPGRLRRRVGLVCRPDPPDPGVTFLSGDIGEAVTTALRAAGGKNLEILGADVAGQCLRRGLVDEILVFVLPVLLGDGIRFFSSPGLARIDLEPLDSARSGAVTILRFRVRK